MGKSEQATRTTSDDSPVTGVEMSSVSSRRDNSDDDGASKPPPRHTVRFTDEVQEAVPSGDSLVVVVDDPEDLPDNEEDLTCFEGFLFGRMSHLFRALLSASEFPSIFFLLYRGLEFFGPDVQFAMTVYVFYGTIGVSTFIGLIERLWPNFSKRYFGPVLNCMACDTCDGTEVADRDYDLSRARILTTLHLMVSGSRLVWAALALTNTNDKGYIDLDETAWLTIIISAFIILPVSRIFSGFHVDATYAAELFEKIWATSNHIEEDEPMPEERDKDTPESAPVTPRTPRALSRSHSRSRSRSMRLHMHHDERRISAKSLTQLERYAQDRMDNKLVIGMMSVIVVALKMAIGLEQARWTISAVEDSIDETQTRALLLLSTFLGTVVALSLFKLHIARKSKNQDDIQNIQKRYDVIVNFIQSTYSWVYETLIFLLIAASYKALETGLFYRQEGGPTQPWKTGSTVHKLCWWSLTGFISVVSLFCVLRRAYIMAEIDEITRIEFLNPSVSMDDNKREATVDDDKEESGGPQHGCRLC